VLGVFKVYFKRCCMTPRQKVSNRCKPVAYERDGTGANVPTSVEIRRETLVPEVIVLLEQFDNHKRCSCS